MKTTCLHWSLTSQELRQNRWVHSYTHVQYISNSYTNHSVWKYTFQSNIIQIYINTISCQSWPCSHITDVFITCYPHCACLFPSKRQLFTVWGSKTRLYAWHGTRQPWLSIQQMQMRETERRMRFVDLHCIVIYSRQRHESSWVLIMVNICEI